MLNLNDPNSFYSRLVLAIAMTKSNYLDEKRLLIDMLNVNRK
jgi:hypothetical protein